MDELKKCLTRYGACRLADGISSLESAVRMMFTPQGREFCVKTGFPTLEFLRAHKEELNTIRGIYIDAGLVRVHYNHDVLIAGETAATLYANKPDRLYKMIAMHGATAYIKAKNYAVVTATEIKGDVVIQNDSTAKVIIEKQEP